MAGVNLSTLNAGQRRIAETLGAPLFVEAGAGSGKTFTLTQRIAWALSPGSGADGAPFLESLDQALVITFTEAAAREIRERVRRALREAGMYEAALSVDAAWISTIHGMCERIVRRHALDLRLDPAFGVCGLSVASALSEQALDEEVGAAFRQAATDKRLAGLFDEFGYAGVVRRIASLVGCAGKAGGFAHLYLPEGGALPQAMARLLTACEALGSVSGLTTAARERMAGTLEALRTFDALAPARRDAARATEALEACALPRSSKAIADVLPAARSALIEARALATLERVRTLSPALLALAERTDERYGHIKRSRSLVDFDDLVTYALAVVEGEGTAARRYAGQFRLVMVDEFQDTDARQLRLISRLATGGAAHLATVGDAQQSIYRFRGADVGVFEARGRELDASQHMRLDTNYRSHGDVLDFVERVCGGSQGVLRGFMHLDDSPDRTDGYRARTLPRVSVELASGPGSAGRASRHQVAVLAAQVADRLAAYRDAGQRAGDMALLLGVTTNAALYIDALRARGLECVVTGGSTFTSASEVATVRALLHTLANPSDTQSGLFPLLSSELFGLDANDFVQLGTRAQEVLSAPTKRSIARGLRTMEFYGTALPSQRLRQASEVLGRAFELLCAMPVADVCLEVIRGSGWLSRLEAAGPDGAARAANVLAAVRHIRELTGDLGLGPARAAVEFDRWLEVAKVAPASLAGDEADVVRVMTIHASKGLEFPVVAVAECWANATAAADVLAGPAADGATAVVVSTSDVATDGLEMGEVPANLAEWHRALRERDLQEGEQEKARLLYVGLTRAREALVLALSCPLSKRGISYRLAGGVTGALFGAELPPVGVSSVGYGGTEPAYVRHVALTAVGDKGGYRADSAASLPGLDGPLSADVASVCAGVPQPAPVAQEASPEEGTVPSASPAGPDACGGCGGRTFVLYERESDDPATGVRLRVRRAREGVFSYTSVHTRLEAMGMVRHDGAQAPSSAIPAGASPSPANAHPSPSASRRGRPPKPSVPTRMERQAEVAGTAMTDDADRATNLGSAFHELAQAMVEAGCSCSESQIDALAAYWHLSERQRRRLEVAIGRWERSELRQEALGFGLVRAEVPFFLAVDDSAFGEYVEGAIDLLCTNEDGGAALVIDYKTGDVGLTPVEIAERHRMQANFYAYVLLQQGFDSVECAFACVEVDDGHGQPTVVRYAFSADDPPMLFPSSPLP